MPELRARALLEIYWESGSHRHSPVMGMARARLGEAMVARGRWRAAIAQFEAIDFSPSRRPWAYHKDISANLSWALALAGSRPLGRGATDRPAGGRTPSRFGGRTALIHRRIARRSGDYLSARGRHRWSDRRIQGGGPVPAFALAAEKGRRSDAGRQKPACRPDPRSLSRHPGQEPQPRKFSRRWVRCDHRILPRRLHWRTASGSRETLALDDEPSAAGIPIWHGSCFCGSPGSRARSIASKPCLRRNGISAPRHRLQRGSDGSGQSAREFRRQANRLPEGRGPRAYRKPEKLEDVRARLGPGETMIAAYIGADRAFVWAIPKLGLAAFAAAPLSRREIATAVSACGGLVSRVPNLP